MWPEWSSLRLRSCIGVGGGLQATLDFLEIGDFSAQPAVKLARAKRLFGTKDPAF